jgi:hypothetical protein
MPSALQANGHMLLLLLVVLLLVLLLPLLLLPLLLLPIKLDCCSYKSNCSSSHRVLQS